MRRLLFLFVSMMPMATFAFAQNPDAIVGIYYVVHEGEESKVRIFMEDDGSYTAQVVWVKNKYDKNGEVMKDEKNPDKSKRNTPCDEIVLIKGMKYNPARNSWGDAKIYDPIRGIRANVNCWFEPDSVLNVRGSLLGFGETVTWDKVE